MSIIENLVLPDTLNAAVGSESREFVVEAGQIKPLKKTVPLFLFGVAWTLGTGFLIFNFWWPFLMGEEISFDLNDEIVTASLQNMSNITVPLIFTVISILVGVGVLAWGIYFLVKKGGYFVGTPERLINYRNGKIRSIDWEQFTGDIEVSGNEKKGDISLQMRTGRMVQTSDHTSSKYVPDFIYISGVSNIFEIEKICRKRIKENDPTPTQK